MAETITLGKVSVSPKGAYSSTTSYTFLDAVSHNGGAFLCLQNSTGVEPGVSSGWQSYWMVTGQGIKTVEITSPEAGKATITVTLSDGTQSSITIDTAAIGTGAIGTNELANGAVTAEKLAPGAATTPSIANGAVTADKLANDAVTVEKLGFELPVNNSIQEAAAVVAAVSGQYVTVCSLTVPVDGTYLLLGFLDCSISSDSLYILGLAAPESDLSQYVRGSTLAGGGMVNAIVGTLLSGEVVELRGYSEVATTYNFRGKLTLIRLT